MGTIVNTRRALIKRIAEVLEAMATCVFTELNRIEEAGQVEPSLIHHEHLTLEGRHIAVEHFCSLSRGHQRYIGNIIVDGRIIRRAIEAKVRPRAILIEIPLIEIAESLTRLRVEFAVQRVSLTIGRSEVSTTDRSDAIVRTSDDLTTSLSILGVNVDQTRSCVEEQTVVIESISRCRSYGESIPLIPPEDHSLIRASTTTSDGEASRSEVLIEVGVSLSPITRSRAVLTGVLGSFRSQLRSRVLRALELEECRLRIVVGTEVVVRNRGDTIKGNILVHIVTEGHQEE